MKPRVLVACEFSGIVRDAFEAIGCFAVSCDLIDTERDGNHYIGDVRKILNKGWDLIVAHPPCTYLTSAGSRWWKGREREQLEALDFVRTIMNADCPRIALENPPGAIGTSIRRADQYIQPWMFGHPENKTTGLWLKQLPALRSTKNVQAQMKHLPDKIKNAVHWATPGPDRWKVRSRTYQGIADAMAAQWGQKLLAENS